MNTTEKMVKSTVLIEAREKTDSRAYSAGTGFFFMFNDINSKQVVVIVTNKHVIENCTTFRFMFRPTYADGILKLEVSNAQDKWIYHDTEDLAIIPLAYVCSHATSALPIRLSASYIDESLIPNVDTIKDLQYIEDVIMIGYPNALIDGFNNLPIARRGITATPYRYDYEGKSSFAIDIAVYGGSSGSPVFLYDHRPCFEDDALHINKEEFSLLGIMSSGPLKTLKVNNDLKDKDVEPEPPVINGNVAIPINVGIAIKSERLLDFIPKLQVCPYA